MTESKKKSQIQTIVIIAVIVEIWQVSLEKQNLDILVLLLVP